MSGVDVGSSAGRLRFVQQCMRDYLKHAINGSLPDLVTPLKSGEVKQHSVKNFFFTDLDIAQLGTFICIGCRVSKVEQMNWITNEHFLALKSPICMECSEMMPS